MRMGVGGISGGVGSIGGSGGVGALVHFGISGGVRFSSGGWLPSLDKIAAFIAGSDVPYFGLEAIALTLSPACNLSTVALNLPFSSASTVVKTSLKSP